ncbi:hypothetical protein [Methylobacterium trifolii]|uniref:Uncharacterized protein n=1 Tax=Methylobacterium trifolii TaxID=1003092 RepID=A0ABQ4U5Z7_9HYPH|nr:hypothetical protein [Methylobacterium trifolii]GJE62589.1 hypothetical protein MPOCJGCO_4722 [Methylobacterium trifolii]
MHREAEARYPTGPHDAEDDHWERDERPRRGLFSRLFSLVKLAVFLIPLALFGYSYFVTDCRAGSTGGGVGQFLAAGVCARNEIVGSAFSLQDNLNALRRVIN